MQTIKLTIPGVGPHEVSALASLEGGFWQLLGTDARQKFWLQLTNTPWPDDVYGRVFLARAVNTLGRAMFPDKWTGYEPSVNTYLRAFPLMSDSADTAQKQEARSLLPPKEDDDNEGRNFIRRRPVFAEGEWDQARALRQKAIDLITPVRQRWVAVRSHIHVGVRDGAFTVHFLGTTGGEFSIDPSPPTHWNTTPAVLENRFYMCQMNPGKPFDSGVAGVAYKWIFLDGEGLETAVSKITKGRHTAEAAAKPVLTLAHKDKFIQRVKDAVKAHPDGPPQRAKLIKEGREIYHLPKEVTEDAY